MEADALLAEADRWKDSQASRVRVATLVCDLNRTLGVFLEASPGLTHEEVLLTLHRVMESHIGYLMRPEDQAPTDGRDPRTWTFRRVDAEVMRVRDDKRREWYRIRPGGDLWSYEDYTGSWTEADLMYQRGPLTEVCDGG